MEEFYEKHPDFGLKGTFYVNLGNSTLRVRELCNRGFNIWLTKDLKLGTILIPI